MNFVPKWKRNQEVYAQMAKGESTRLSQRMSGPNEEAPAEVKPPGVEQLPIEKIIGDPNPELDMQTGPETYVKPAPLVAPPQHEEPEEQAEQDAREAEPVQAEEEEREEQRQEGEREAREVEARNDRVSTEDPIVCVGELFSLPSLPPSIPATCTHLLPASPFPNHLSNWLSRHVNTC